MSIRAAITGVGKYVPETILSNADLEKMVDTSDEWITSRTGIKERRIFREEGKGSSELGARAVKDLLEKTGTDPNEIGLVVCGTVTADMKFPDNANTICDKVGINNAFGFDINAACSGFLFSVTTAAQFIERGTVKKAIVVGADLMSSIVDYEDRTTCVIFGDGAAAVLLEADDSGLGLIDYIHKGDGSGREFLHLKAGGSLKPASVETLQNKEHFLFQNGRPVFKAAVSGMSSTIKELLERNNLTKEDISWVVPHQANLRIIHAVADSLDFPKEKVMMNISKYGNTTSATIPLCLNDYEKQMKKGDFIVLTAFGGGFTWGSTLLRWAYDAQ